MKLYLICSFLILSGDLNCVLGVKKEVSRLHTCCNYQKQFSEENSACSEKVPKNPLDFDEFLNLPTTLLSYAFRNRTSAQNIRYKLEREGLSCRDGSFSVTLDLGSGKNPSDPNHLIYLTPNGYLQIGLDYYSQKEFCIDSINDGKVSFEICKPMCDEKSPCIPKCCELGELWSFENNSPECKVSTQVWEPPLYLDKKTKMSGEKRKDLKTHYILNHPVLGYCEYGHPFLINLKSLEEGVDGTGILFRLLSDGSIITRVRRRQWAPLPKGHYCLDGIVKGRNSISGENGSDETILLYCHKEIQTSESTISKIYGISMMISSVFLILTLVIFGLLWEKHRNNIQRWTITAYVSSLLIMYIFFIISYFSEYFDTQTATNIPICRFVGIGMHYFFLTTFFFLTCVNIEIWWSVRSFSSKWTSKYFHGFRRLLAYIGFSCGSPLVILITGLVLESLFDSDMNSEVIIPEYGRFTCNLGSRDAFWAYMYGPVGFLLICNIAFFITTLTKIWNIIYNPKNKSTLTPQHKKQTKVISRFIKLYIIQGVPWVFELLSFAAHEDEFRWYWILFDLINIFQSLAIFIIFCANSTTIYQLIQKYPSLNRFLHMFVNKDGIEELEEEEEEKKEESGKLSHVEIGPLPARETIELS